VNEKETSDHTGIIANKEQNRAERDNRYERSERGFIGGCSSRATTEEIKKQVRARRLF